MTDRIMQDNKHYKADRIDGFWDFVTRDPGDYVGRHRDDAEYPGPNVIHMGCGFCVASLS